jgi:hypothetical protein
MRKSVSPPAAPRFQIECPAEALGGWCLLRSSKPLSGAGCGVGGGFDSHALPPAPPQPSNGAVRIPCIRTRPLSILVVIMGASPPPPPSVGLVDTFIFYVLFLIARLGQPGHRVPARYLEALSRRRHETEVFPHPRRCLLPPDPSRLSQLRSREWGTNRESDRRADGASCLWCLGIRHSRANIHDVHGSGRVR